MDKIKKVEKRKGWVDKQMESWVDKQDSHQAKLLQNMKSLDEYFKDT